MKKMRSMLGCLIFFLSVGVAFANPFEETIRILENRTAFHWGRDCFIWLVHYSEDLVDPWVEAEAGRMGMSDVERRAYRESFISDLSIGTAEPVLVTIHAFGARPLSFAPFSERIVLITPRGERIRPIRYNRALDQPLSGVVQGLVFFPKQSDPNFAIGISGMGVYDERIFSFVNEGAISGYVSITPPPEEIEVVVVELPPAPRPTQTPRAPARREPPPLPPPPPPQPLQPPVIPAAEPEIVVVEAPPEEDSDRDIAYVSREQVLRTFLDLWMKFDVGTMYSMLSEISQRQFTRQEFETDLRELTDFRSALRGGYRIDWLGANQARIVTARRILFIRTLLDRTFGVVREGSTWKIVW